MKTTLPVLLSKPASVRGLLVQGDDAGGARYAAQRFLEAQGAGFHRFDANDLSARPDAIEGALTSGQTLFGAASPVLVSGFNGRHGSLVSQWATKAVVPFAFIASALEAKSVIVKLFEGAEDLAHIACKPLDARAKTALAQSMISKIDPQALAILGDMLSEDSGVARAQLDTLRAYLDQSPCQAEDVRAILDDAGSAEIDLVIQAVLDAQPNVLVRALQRLPPGENKDMGLLRLLHWQVQRLYACKGSLDAGVSAERAMSALRPPVWPAQKAQFQRRLQAWSIKGLEGLLAKLTEAEALQKRGLPGDLSTSMTLLMLAHAGAR